MHPQEQQLEGRGEEPPIRLGMGEGGEQRPGIRPRPSQEGRRDGKRGGLLWGVVVTRDNSVTKARTRHPRGERARVGGGHGRTEERERGGRIGHDCTGGFHGAQRRGGRHHRGDEDVAGCGATARTPRDSQLRRRTRAHACDAAPPARARLAAWAAAKCARASASASASDFASFASSAARSSPKRVDTASSALRLACSRA